MVASTGYTEPQGCAISALRIFRPSHIRTYELVMDAYGRIESVEIKTMEQIWEDLDKVVAVFSSTPAFPHAPLRDTLVFKFEAMINTLVAHHRTDPLMHSEGVHMTACVDVGDMAQARAIFESLVDSSFTMDSATSFLFNSCIDSLAVCPFNGYRVYIDPRSRKFISAWVLTVGVILEPPVLLAEDCAKAGIKAGAFGTAGSASTVTIGAGVIGDVSTHAERGGFFFWSLQHRAYGRYSASCAHLSVCIIVITLFLPETLRIIVGNGSIPLPKIYYPIVPIIGRRAIDSHAHGRDRRTAAVPKSTAAAPTGRHPVAAPYQHGGVLCILRHHGEHLHCVPHRESAAQRHGAGAVFPECVQTLMLDLMPSQGSAITACNNLVRCSLGAGLVSAIQPILEALCSASLYQLPHGPCRRPCSRSPHVSPRPLSSLTRRRTGTDRRRKLAGPTIDTNANAGSDFDSPTPPTGWRTRTRSTSA
ncbi:hypothetical protein B0H11DRAFT_2210930 [Mycena galericulata]|nr:hypothetical protein B0H11DRAFT_2210930 [Mycena galericulata]